MKVLMLPHLQHFRSEESGIKRVVESYFKHLPAYDIEFVTEGMQYDVRVVHAGTSEGCDVAACHGLYWTGDYPAITWEWAVNAKVIDNLRTAKEITVPSQWVAESIRRDMRRQPHVIGHGIDWQDWQEDPEQNSGYVLWNKNRQSDVCDPTPVTQLAERFKKVHFVSTFANADKPPNVTLTGGVVPHMHMERLIKAANVYLATTKETFGIGTLEAMAAGVPVLGYAHGGNLDLVVHGQNGYLAEPGNLDDLAMGLNYCMQHRDVLGENGREMAREWSWEKVCEKIAGVYRLASTEPPAAVTVVVPSYNYGDKIGRALASIQAQSFKNFECIIVDDGSTDGSETKIPALLKEMDDERFRYVRQENKGVAIARNRGVSEGTNKYVCCLDADDAIAERFLEVCVRALEEERGLGIAYTSLWFIRPDGKEGVSPWPPQWDFNAQVRRRNQVPTCCVFRRDMWESLGGYRSRYCPRGAGSEDAEFWLRSGAYGWAAKKVTEEALFIYSDGSGRVSGASDYNEPDWLVWHPWTRDDQHPFASHVRPKRWSHPVRQYDEPVVSVVIPMGPGHTTDVINALDSLDAQTYRSWEAILVNDTGAPVPEWLEKAFPHVRNVLTEGTRGAGAARNAGARIARGNFLLFLDADDWLYPEFLEKVLRLWESNEACIYTDYVGKAVVQEDYAAAMISDKRLLSYDRDSGNAVIAYEAAEYDWQRAQRQPEENRPWIWCNITTLVPLPWHMEVGGFDEKMPSWEDVDYWYRIAKMGKPFVRLPEQLMVYQFHSGNRRQEGYENFEELTAYMQDKYKEVENVACIGCRGKRNAPAPVAQNTTVHGSQVADSEFVACEYVSTKRNQQPIVGSAGFQWKIEGLHMIKGRDNLWHIHYGFRAGGERFLVHQRDISEQPHVYKPIAHKEIRLEKKEAPAPPAPIVPVQLPSNQPTIADIAKVAAPDPVKTAENDLAAALLQAEQFGGQHAEKVPEPEEIVEAVVAEKDNGPLNLQLIPGVTPSVAEELTSGGVTTLEAFLAMGEAGLQQVNGVGPARAKSIWTAIERMQTDARQMEAEAAADLEAANAS